MSTQNIIIAAIIIIIGYLLLRTISKVFFKILFIIFLIGALVYILLFYRGGLLDLGNKEFILYELQEKYCTGEDKDQVKCECIINPLLKEFNKKYSGEEIKELQKNKAKSIKEILKIANVNKEKINACLKENKSESVWKDFIKDVKKIDVKDKIKQIFQESDSVSVKDSIEVTN
jgi:hypothetical protein